MIIIVKPFFSVYTQYIIREGGDIGLYIMMVPKVLINTFFQSLVNKLLGLLINLVWVVQTENYLTLLLFTEVVILPIVLPLNISKTLHIYPILLH